MNPTKVNRQIISLLIMITFTLMSSCSKDDTSPNNQTQQQIINIVKSGNWRITKFIDSGNDETSHFTGYSFVFNDNGVLAADNGANPLTGTWSITDRNSNDDSLDDLNFNIYFNLINDFEDLNDDWNIISFSETKIELIDISGGNGGTDYLTFMKN